MKLIVNKNCQSQSLGNLSPFIYFAYNGTLHYKAPVWPRNPAQHRMLGSSHCFVELAVHVKCICSSWVNPTLPVSSLSILPTVSLMQISAQLLGKVGMEGLVTNNHSVQAPVLGALQRLVLSRWSPKFIFPVSFSNPGSIHGFVYHLSPMSWTFVLADLYARKALSFYFMYLAASHSNVISSETEVSLWQLY